VSVKSGIIAPAFPVLHSFRMTRFLAVSQQALL
jgi:hypothetical protein